MLSYKKAIKYNINNFKVDWGEKITSEKAMPSMKEFFEICRYFGITPYEFFNENMKYPEKIHKIIKGIKKLNEKDTELIINLIESYKDNNKKY